MTAYGCSDNIVVELIIKCDMCNDTVIKQVEKYWTNPSVLQLARESDPTEAIKAIAQEKVLLAIQAGWEGPPFDPFKLAEVLDIPTVPREDVLDARIVPVGSQRLQIEYNPNRPKARVRFSIAHEIAHALFPDCIQNVRNRIRVNAARDDEWQIELLCNIAAAELIMPVGSELDSETPVTIDNLLRLQRQFQVSTEAISIRMAKITLEPCTLIAAARVLDDEARNVYRLDYCIPSRTSMVGLQKGLAMRDTVFSQCTAVGYTAKAGRQTIGEYDDLRVECVGIPPFPGKNYPRIVAILSREKGETAKALSIVTLYGDALIPRKVGTRIIAQIVNDKTPNWGAGFGRALKIKYPMVQKDFKDWALANPNDFSLGNTHLSEATEDIYIANMIAQHGYGESAKPRIRYAALINCLRQLKIIALAKGASVHMPRIGTGYAGGNWSYILELIDEILVRSGIDVNIYTLPDFVPKDMQGILRLDKQTIKEQSNKESE